MAAMSILARLPRAVLLCILGAGGVEACGRAETPPRSRIAFAAEGKGLDRAIWVIESDGTGLAEVAPDPEIDETPSWLPDGSALSFMSERDGLKGLYLWDGASLRRIAASQTFIDRGHSWSPDGRWTVFSSSRDGNWELYTMSSVGSHHERLTEDPAIDEWPAWSPRSEEIAFISERGGQRDLYLFNLQEPKKLRRLTNDRAYDGRPAWSPDGTRIAWPSEREGKTAIFVTDPEGKSFQRLTPKDVESDWPAWSPDGKQIAFVSNREGFDEIWVMQADGTRPRRLTTLRSSKVYTPAWSPFLK